MKSEEEKDSLIDVVELALDWGLPISDEMIKAYESEIHKRECVMDGRENISRSN